MVDGFSDENTCRKDFTPTEAAAMGMALEPLAKADAKQRQVEAGKKHGRGKIASVKVTEPIGQAVVREKVGAAVGMSGPTYQRAKWWGRIPIAATRNCAVIDRMSGESAE